MTDQRPETPVEATLGFSLEEMARRVGGYQWLEMQMFEILGSWVKTIPEHPVKLRLGADCYHHSWHAELWQQRLPELRELAVDRLVAPVSPQLMACVAAVREPQGQDQTLEKLVGAYRVLIPYKISMYTDHLRKASLVSDGPIIRTLTLALNDEMDDWREGEMLIRSLITRPDDAVRAAAHQGRLDALLASATLAS
jgi:hypothetical protein